MVQSACIGFCRSSNNQKLSETVNDFISGKITEHELKVYCKNVRLENLKTQKDIGIDIIPSNDFAMYDHMLDATCLVGNIQRRYYWEGGKIPLEIYFSLANGIQKDKFDVVPLKLQNWLNTNYLYHVPEFVSPIDFAYSDNKPIVEYLDASRVGIETRSSIIAPITYLLQGKSLENDIEPIDLVDEILPVYYELFENYKRLNVKSIQLEDPMICLAIDREMKSKYRDCYEQLRKYAGDIELHLVTYYCNLYENFDFICSLPVNSIHLDMKYNYSYVDDYLKKINNDVKFSIGVVDGSDIWKNNLQNSINVVSKFCDKIGEDNVIVATSSPLFLCPYSLALETKIPNQLCDKLSFAVEKLNELEVIKKALNDGVKSVESEIKENKKIFTSQRTAVSFNDFIYGYKDKKIVHANENRDCRWRDFTKKNKLNHMPIMFASEIDIETQNNSNSCFVSVDFTKKNYDISDYQDKTEGMFVLERNMIPRFGSDYYNPTIVYDYLKIKDDVFKQCINDVKKKTQKPLKFAVCSPLHFMNFAFVNPFLDQKKNYEKFATDLEKAVNNVAKEICILQINDTTFQTNTSINYLRDAGTMNAFCYKLNEFLSGIKNIDCLALYNLYCNINDSVDFLSKMDIDLLLLSSSRSTDDIFNIFAKYKPEICIGFGIIDLNSVRITTKNEVLNTVQKILSLIDEEKIVFSIDGKNNHLQRPETIAKSLKNTDTAIKSLVKEIEKKQRKSDALVDKKTVKKKSK